MGALLWLVPLLGVSSASAILPRDYPHDQIRFMHCSEKGVSDTHSHLQIGYYKWAPQPSNQAQIWDELLSYGALDSGWDHGHNIDSIALSTALKYSAHITKYKYSPSTFQSWVGTVTYNGNGFNCFLDDKHAVHSWPGAGQCYVDIYCTHQTATKLEILASKDTITLQQRTSFTPKDVLKVVEKQIRGGLCDSAKVGVAGGAYASFSCEGDMNAVKLLGKTLQGPLAGFEDAFKKESVQKCATVCKPCSPPEPRCRDCKQECHEETKITMPSHYSLQISNVPPPNAPTGNQPSLQAKLEAELDRVDGSDGALCGALGGAAGYGALFTPVSAFFGAASLAIGAACGGG